MASLFDGIRSGIAHVAVRCGVTPGAGGGPTRARLSLGPFGIRSESCHLCKSLRLRLNFEFNVECYDENLAKSLNEIVDKKAQSAHEVTLDEVNRRTFPIRLRDGLARLLTPYL